MTDSAPTYIPQPRWLGYAARLNLVVGILYVAIFLFFAFRARFTVPYIDDWSWLASLQDHPLTKGLWQPHNEHIIVVPRLMLWMDYWIWGWPGYVTLVAALLSHAVVAAVLVAACRSHDRDETLLLSGSVLVLTFLTYNLQGVVFPGAVLFPLVAAFSVSAVACVAKCAGNTDVQAIRAWAIAGAVMCVLAMLCLTNGLALPFVLVGLSLILRLPRGITMMFLAIGITGV